jgi:hypothetical protein
LFNSNVNKNCDENNTSSCSTNDRIFNIFNVNYSKVYNESKSQYINFRNAILINDYTIFNDEIISQGNNSIIYKGKKNDSEEIYVSNFLTTNKI